MTDRLNEAEDQIQALISKGKYSEAVTLAVRAFGPQLQGFLVGLTRNPNEAEDAYQMTMEDVWKGVKAYRGDCPFRKWMFVIAKHAAYRRTRVIKPGRKITSIGSSIAAIVASSGYTSRPWTSGMLVAFDALWRSLDSEERQLLLLKLVAELSYDEIVELLGERGVSTTAQALRAKVHRVKQRLDTCVNAVSASESPQRPPCMEEP